MKESRKIRISQNVLKQPKRIIESRFGNLPLPPVDSGSVPAPISRVPQTPSGSPSWPPQGSGDHGDGADTNTQPSSANDHIDLDDQKSKYEQMCLLVIEVDFAPEKVG